MFIIKTNFTKGRNGGYYISKIYECYIDPRNLDKIIMVDKTEIMKNKLGLQGGVGEIVILHGNGHGSNIIKELLIEHTGISTNQVFDI